MNHIKPYKDLQGQYRYKIVSRNGRTLAKIFAHPDVVPDALLALKLLK